MSKYNYKPYKKGDGYDIIKVSENMCCDSKEEIVENVFQDFVNNVGDDDYFKNRILLATTHGIVDELID